MNIISKILQLNANSVQVLQSCQGLTYLGDPVLRNKTQKVTFKVALKIAEQLTNTLLSYRKITGLGRGLAAPQIGQSSAVFVTYIDEKIRIYINPLITSSSQEHNLYKECCMSSHHVWCDVERPSAITMTFTNENNEQVIESYSGFIARLIQHEYDHLLGIVNLDRAVPGTIEYCLGDPLKENLRDS